MFQNLVGKKGLSIDRLATLCHIAEAGCISAAAGDNANLQSQYSRQVAELEEFFGTDLLDRSSRPYRLSQSGRELGRLGRDYLGALDAFAARCGDQPAQLVIGAGESMIHWLLIPEVLPQLKRALPNTNFVFRTYQTEAMVRALHDGQIDLAFVRRNAVPDSLRTRGRWPLQPRLFVPKKFRAKLSPPVGFDQLGDLPMAVLGGDGQLRSRVDELARTSAVPPNFAIECSSSTQIALLVQRKECCAILPSFARSQFERASIDDFPVKGLEALGREFCLAWDRRRSDLLPIITEAARVASRTA